MNVKRYNKATAAVLAGAVTTVIGGFLAIDAEVLGAVQTLLTAVLVWLVPNAA
jgi:hypothetical protein